MMEQELKAGDITTTGAAAVHPGRRLPMPLERWSNTM